MYTKDMNNTTTTSRKEKAAQRKAQLERVQRFLAYCAANDKRPKAMLAHDARQFPGGKMAGFILWMESKWAEWRKMTNSYGVLSEAQTAAFDAWIQEAC